MGSINSFLQISKFEGLDLSTLLIIHEALRREVKVEMLDRKDQFIRFTKGRHVEYMKEGTITSKDSFVHNLMTDNKYVTKQILQENKIVTPTGEMYGDRASALLDYKKLKGQKIVIKPKSTDCGRGISILPANFVLANYKKALTLAFQWDKNILIEKFIEGIECRFLVINYRNIAVLRRIPANITGDGKHTIEELVTLKNKDPKRGNDNKRPLRYIELGSIEKQNLKIQKLSFQSIPSKGIQIFLRSNSNISTGGDAIDYTEKVHEGYRSLAEKAARLFKIKICGIDIILKDFSTPPTPKNYALLEVNNMPGLSMHAFPTQGKNPHVEKYILDLLGF